MYVTYKNTPRLHHTSVKLCAMSLVTISILFFLVTHSVTMHLTHINRQASVFTQEDNHLQVLRDTIQHNTHHNTNPKLAKSEKCMVSQEGKRLFLGGHIRDQQYCHFIPLSNITSPSYTMSTPLLEKCHSIMIPASIILQEDTHTQKRKCYTKFCLLTAFEIFRIKSYMNSTVLST